MVASHVSPIGNLACNQSMCPDWESNWWPFGSQLALNTLSYTSQGNCCSFTCILQLFMSLQTIFFSNIGNGIFWRWVMKPKMFLTYIGLQYFQQQTYLGISPSSFVEDLLPPARYMTSGVREHLPDFKYFKLCEL